MSDFSTTLQFLYGLQFFGIKMGLKNTRTLLTQLGNPERTFPSVHIAGTNGKGSTSAMIASILTASGYKTGLYTSPHLVRFNERIRIDGRPISDHNIVLYTREMKPIIQKLRLTFFEATTAMAFKYFTEQKVDIAVIETGLGGRLDATNVIHPLASVITNIGLDHTEHLGSTYRSIAREKAGIIKKGVPCITAADEPSALLVIRKVAKRNQADLTQVRHASSTLLHDQNIYGMDVSVGTQRHSYHHLHLPLCGSFQERNLQTAILTLERLKDSGFKKISRRTIREGLSDIGRNSGLHGRMEVLSRSPLIIGDVAHNLPGVESLMQSLQKVIEGTVVTLFGVMKDKDYRGMIKKIVQHSRLIVAVKPRNDRSLPSNSIVTEIHKYSAKALDGKGVDQGLKIAIENVRKKEPLLILGSHYVVGESIKALKNGKI